MRYNLQIIIGVGLAVAIATVIAGFSFCEAISGMMYSESSLEEQRRRILDQPLPGALVAQEQESITSLIAQLRAGDPNERSQAARAISESGIAANEAVPALAEALKDEDRDVRLAAAYALGEIAQEANLAVPALVEGLKDEDFVVLFRAACAEALGRFGPQAKSTIPALRDAAQEDHPYVRRLVLEALDQIDPETGVRVREELTIGSP
jgi:HEAT repeat protein